MTTTLEAGTRVRVTEEFLKGYEIHPEDGSLEPVVGQTGTVLGLSNLGSFYRVTLDESPKHVAYELFLPGELQAF